MNKLGLGHELNVSQTLEMMLSPRMLQMLKMLNLSYIGLLEEIEQRSEENVMLEVESPDRLLDYLKTISLDKIPKKEIPGEELPGIEALADMEESLEQHLIKQLDLEDLTDKERKIAEHLIGSINSNGYIHEYATTSADIIEQLGADQKDIDKMLEVIQRFDPDGIGARNLKECLLIQVREHNFESEELADLLEKAIEDHMDDIADKNYGKLASSLKITKDGAAHLVDFIKNNLNPTPGSLYSEAAVCVIPSFAIKKENDTYKVVNLEKKYGPMVKLSPTYQKMLKDPKTDAKSIQFLKEKLESAKEFIENINKRHETIEKILNIILAKQSGFFDAKSAQLNPLMQKDLADELGVHPSTISRAISNKYLQTDKGVLLLKTLCPREIKGLTGEKILKLVDEIIKSEDRSAPLSDDDIRLKLKEKGMELERRTVAAYRKKLGIGTSSKRMSAPGGKS